MITGFFVYDPHCNWRHHVGCGSRYLCCFVMTDTVGTYGEPNVNKVRDRYRYRVTKRRHKTSTYSGRPMVSLPSLGSESSFSSADLATSVIPLGSESGFSSADLTTSVIPLGSESGFLSADLTTSASMVSLPSLGSE